MDPRRALAAFVCMLPVAAQIPIRVGLDVQNLEWIVSLEGGGAVCSRAGKPLLRLRDGEKLRIWWDARGEADPAAECRIQVGRATDPAAAEALMQRLRGLGLGDAPERVFLPDGGTWRVLLGHFERPALAEELLARLGAAGFDELWISTESRPGALRKGRALYAVTERYERIPLPIEGVLLKPEGELTKVEGKGRYRGRVEVFPNLQGRLTVTDTVDLETYLRGVVPKEMGAWEYPALEALKAQAVAARTYAYANRGKRTADGFDLLDTVADQVYGGRDGEQPLTDRAVQETKGLIATYGGKPIQALFMANGGGATVDNTFVFGGAFPYLQGVSSYTERPRTVAFSGALAPGGDQAWLGWELLRLAAAGLLPFEGLEGERLARNAQPADLKPVVAGLAARLELPPPEPCLEQGPALLLWMARSLGLERAVPGLERPQDADYFLGGLRWKPEDRLLAAFLSRRGLVPPAVWRNASLSLGQALAALGKCWQELEPMELSEGTLLMDGQVRPKGSGPGPLSLAPSCLLAEEAPGGSLRLVTSTAAQVGDRLKWIQQEGGARLLVRRLDPDGASLDRYNPTAHWKVELKEAELLERLATKAGIHGLSALEAQWNDQGRVLELVVRDAKNRPHRFSGMRIRGLLGLKDNAFRFLQLGQEPHRRWIFFGRGWGHGVGMDQSGAYGMALEGHAFDAILKHYYQGIALTRIGE